ncbi:adhesin [Saccharothrix sp. HUAS TT1]|uniref:adhesin n=1 Tax=unclassified Saccharothrix TaxID=2593673 RepID=UPI00345BE581
MLDITHAAGAVIGGLAGGAGGLRIDWADRDGVRAITLAIAARPVTHDEVVASPTGGLVFLAPAAARHLSDKLLDVRMDVDGRFRFAFNHKH